MRHLGSLVSSLVLGALGFVLLCLGVVKWSVSAQTATFGGVSAGSRSSHWEALAIALAATLGAGVALAPLVLARLSPVGPVLIGLAYLVVSLWALFAPDNYTRAVPNGSFGVAGLWWAPAASPILLLVAIPLLATILSPRRWRRWGNAPAAVAPAPGYTPPPAMPGSPTYPTSGYPTSGAPGYPTSGAPGYPTSGAPGYPAPGTPTYPATPSYPPLPPPAPAYGTAYPAPAPAEPAPGTYAAPGSPVGFPPPPDPFDDPEATRRL